MISRVLYDADLARGNNSVIQERDLKLMCKFFRLGAVFDGRAAKTAVALIQGGKECGNNFLGCAKDTPRNFFLSCGVPAESGVLKKCASPSVIDYQPGSCCGSFVLCDSRLFFENCFTYIREISGCFGVSRSKLYIIFVVSRLCSRTVSYKIAEQDCEFAGYRIRRGKWFARGVVTIGLILKPT